MFQDVIAFPPFEDLFQQSRIILSKHKLQKSSNNFLGFRGKNLKRFKLRILAIVPKTSTLTHSFPTKGYPQLFVNIYYDRKALINLAIEFQSHYIHGLTVSKFPYISRRDHMLRHVPWRPVLDVQYSNNKSHKGSNETWLAHCREHKPFLLSYQQEQTQDRRFRNFVLNYSLFFLPFQRHPSLEWHLA